MENNISIKQLNATRDSRAPGEPGVSEPFMFVVTDNERKVMLGSFNVVTLGSVENAHEAALACKAKYVASGGRSPFLNHRKVLLADYGGAQSLAAMTLSLYNGLAFPFDLSRLGGLDQQHLEIAIELMRSYHQFGEGDPDFLAVAKEIKSARGIGQETAA